MILYKLLVGYDNPDSLTAQVNTYLEAGWELHGSPSASISTAEGSTVETYIQAVVLPENVQAPNQGA